MPPIPSWSPVYILYHCLRPAADCVGELHCNCWHASWNPDDAVLSGAQYLEDVCERPDVYKTARQRNALSFNGKCVTL